MVKNMLKKLNISNLAVIDKQSLDFSKGFTVLTGETGAGKSVVIDCINMILGHRCDKTLVRYGKKSAVAEAVFDVNEKVKSILENEGIFDADDGVCISRSLSSEGKSVCRINALTVSAAFLKSVGTEIVNIHGQQDNQKLLSKKYHTDILDRYISLNGGGDVIEKYQSAYKEYRKAKAEFDKLSKNREETQKEINYLQFIASELSEAAVYEGEEKELCEKQEILANAKEIYVTLMESCNMLYEGEQSAYSFISCAAHMISKISGYSEKLKQINESLNECMYQIQDIAGEARDFCDECDTDERQLEETDARLSLIFDLKRKYKKSADELVGYEEEVKERLNSLFAQNIDEAEKNCGKLFNNAKKCADDLSKERLKYKKILEEKIYSALADLNMKNVRFEIALSKCELSEKGAEEAEFLMCTTGRGEMREMEKIASGGELSRIMLAIKYVLSDADDCETLIFDEIDTGVSGASAQAVAKKLYALSKKKQVICITHLPQIASMADNHMFINKIRLQDGSYSTEVSVLSESEKAAEIARIIDGNSENESVIAAAKEMIENAKKIKSEI